MTKNSRVRVTDNAGDILVGGARILLNINQGMGRICRFPFGRSDPMAMQTELGDFLRFFRVFDINC